MDTKILEYLIAIAERKSISAAADTFYLTQPVLSRHLKHVEERVGTKLFVREHNEMRLTDAGKIYVANARAILYEQEKLAQQLGDLRKGRKYTVRVIVDDYLRSFFNRHVAGAMQEILGRRELVITSGNVFLAQEALKSATADMAVVKCGAGHDPEMTMHVLYRDEIVLALPRAWLTPAIQEGIAQGDLSALQDHCFIMERTDAVMRQQEQLAMNAYHIMPWMVREMSGSAHILQMVRQEKGVAFLPKGLCMPSSEVIALPMQQPFHIAVLHEANRFLDAQDQQMLALLSAQYGQWDAYMESLYGTQSASQEV